jgi:hypothetical protein
VTASDPDAGDTPLTVRMRMGYRDGVGNQYYRIGGTQTMTWAGGTTYTFTLTQALFTSWGWNTSDREITYDVTAYDTHGGVSATLYSHNLTATQLMYQPISSCGIF